MKEACIFTIPNTKEGLSALKYLSSELVKHNILIKLVTKKEFNLLMKDLKTEKCLADNGKNHCHPTNEECLPLLPPLNRIIKEF